MSFNYSNNMGRNPMHNMMPLMNNLANGAAGTNSNNIISQIAAVMSAAASANNLPSNMGPQPPPPPITAPNTSTAPPPIASIGGRVVPSPSTFNNDSPLEFKRLSANTNRSNSGGAAGPSKPSYSFQSRETINSSKNNQMGAGPMDLENENENATSSNFTDLRRFLSGGPLNNQEIQKTANPEQQSTAVTSAAAAAGGTAVTDNGAQMFLNSMLHQGFMMMQPTMMMDPNMALQMQQYPMIPDINNPPDPNAATQLSGIIPTPGGQVKEVIHCKSCTLFPPNPTAPAPTIRDRPPGCRTVFVGGLPETITEPIIREIFESCGEITTLRLSKKNFCHIRFVYEASVDSAIYLSGYRVRILNNEPTNCGRLHVDFAQARDDQYEWECRQRQLQREQRHRERMERDRLRSVSPPPVVHYTEHEASTLSDKLKNDDTFMKAVQTLIVWLERGDCSKKNANVFYSMIQSTNAHVRRLNTDKMQYEEDLRIAREQYRKQMLGMTQQFTQIEKVFSAASHKKVWDHFTKAQRKNIDQWKKLSMEIRSVQIEDDEMEMSDEDRDFRSSSSKRCRFDNDNLKEENDSLRCQLEAFKNEMTLVKSDIKSDTDFRDKQIKVLQETIRNMQTQLLENKSREKKDANKIDDLEQKLKEANVKQLLLKTKIVEVSARHSNHSSKSSECDEVIVKSPPSIVKDHDVIEVEEDDDEKEKLSHDNKIDIKDNYDQEKPKTEESKETKSEILDLDEARIIGLVSTFLVVHPMGAASHNICSYLQNITKNPSLQSERINEILQKYSNLFKTDVNDIDVEPKWRFCGFVLPDNQNN
ncbi:ecto-NOX disulfide-thiol exchanger 2 [Episyrphus balteatus]|uniref:ecto-NOX disulfide-thiol exchanger 2 n=1 Tax=Episyrphus balteatus TaxID=286459 RepID=UPI0024850233|nr:ecto-NOX disulfide-thiol exchanger 2 [Episyrphus balteatus]